MNVIVTDYIKKYELLHRSNAAVFDGKFSFRTLKRKLFKIVAVFKRPVTILDYGCGKGGANEIFVHQHARKYIQCLYLYDPAHIPLSKRPSEGMKFDAVLSADVVEHIPENGLEDIFMDMISFLSEDGVLVVRTTSHPALKRFPNGENLHCTLWEPEKWDKFIQSIWSGRYILLVDFIQGMSISDFETIEEYVEAALSRDKEKYPVLLYDVAKL